MTSTLGTLRRSRWPWESSIQWRLIIVVLIVVIVPIVAIFTFSFIQTANTLQTHAEEDVKSLTTSVTKNVDRYLFERRGDITVLSQSETLTSGLDSVEAQTEFLKSYQDIYQAYTSLVLTDTIGNVQAATDETKGDQSNEDWFKNARDTKTLFLSDVYLNRAQGIVLTISAPVFADDGTFLGVIAGNVDINKLIEIVGSTKIGDNGEVVIVNSQGRIAIDPDIAVIFKDINHLKGIQAALRGESGTIIDVNDDGDPALVYYVPDIGLENWIAFVNVPLAELNAPVVDLATRAVLLGLIAIAVISVAILFVARRLVQPIQQLTRVAGRLSAGEFNTPIPVQSADEIGQLANTFRIMSRELQGLVDTLEERVESRTQDLATTIEVGRLANSIQNQNELLPQLVEYIRSKFDLYYTQIYLLDEANRFAILRAATGEAGKQLLARQHKLDMEETSLVARAVKTREAVIVSDTASNPSHKPNALLPETRSETAIPLQVGDTILGVLDMQANRSQTFTTENASVFLALGGQIAAVLRGAQAFDEVRAATIRSEAINERLTNEAWGGYLGDLTNGQRIGYEYDLEAPRPISDQSQVPAAEQISESIVVRGAKIGNIVVKNDDSRFQLQADDEALIQETARRVAQALDQFRAFDEVKRSEENARSVQNFLDSIIENIPNMVFVKDAQDLRFISLNKAGEDLLGVKREDMIGKNDYDFYPEEQANWFTANDRQVLANNEMVDIAEEPIQAAGGETRFLHTKKIPIRDAQGNARFLLGISEDITDRKQAQAALVESERRYRQIIEEATDVVYTIDAGGFFTYISPSVRRLTGFNEQELVGKHFTDLLPKGEGWRKRLIEFYTEQVTQQIPQTTLVFPILTKQGERRWVEQQVSLTMQDGSIVGLQSVTRDVTERILAEEQLLLRNQAIESSTSGITIADIRQPDMPLIYVNEAFSRVTGYSVEEALGRNCRFLQNNDRDQEGLVELRAALKEGRPTTITLRNYRKNGEMFYNELSISPVFDANNIMTHFVGVSNDITSRILQEQSIIDSRNRTELLGLVNAALSQATDDEQILTAISVLLEEDIDHRTTLAYVDDNDLGEPISARVVASIASFENQHTEANGTELIQSYSSVFKKWGEGLQAPVYIEDVATDTSLDEVTRDYLKSTNTSALIAVPLRTGSDWQAIVLFGWADPHPFSDGLRETIETIIPTAASVVASRRAYLETLVAREQAERRSVNMEAVAQVSATATTILDLDELLKTVSYLTKERFGLYHAHIYLLNDEGDRLVLAAGAGEAGDIMKERRHFIPLNREHSLVAQSARERTPIIANDIAETPNFLPNPLLPGTRSELAVPMVVANKLVGVLDVQDDHIDRFSDEDVRVQIALANQVAVAVENGRAFLESQKTADRLREVDKLKSQFLANMSHELRTPLNSIIGYAEVLLDGIDGDLNEEATEDVQAIHGGGKHLLTIINDILDLAKIEAGQMFIEPRETSLMPVIEDVMNTCDILARNKGLQLHITQQSEIPTVKGDSIRLKQIILNLVNNAIKFTDSGSITVDMSLDSPHMVKIRVIDTGMGMNEDELGGLFQQFHQVDGSPTRRAGGTGLGLVITRHLVTMHGGVVSVESKKGEGTTFWFTVPVWALSTQTMRRVSSTAVN